MKVQIVQRNEHFFVRRKVFFVFHGYMARHLLWWSVEIYPNERRFGFTSLEKAKAGLTKYVENERANKEFLNKDKERRRLRRNPMVVVEEIEIDV
jgi:hypothetical protein